MGKNTRDLRSFCVIENKPPMADELFVNGEMALGTKKNKKKRSKDFKLGTKRVSNGAVQENCVSASPLKRLGKTPKKKKKKMGSPIIVEDRAGEYPKFPLPLTLRHRPNPQPSMNTLSLRPFDIGKKKKRNKARITTVECIKPIVEKLKITSSKSRHVNDDESMGMENSKFSSNQDESSTSLAMENSANFDSLELETESNKPFENVSIVGKKSDSSLKISEQTESKQSPRFYSFRDQVLAIMEPDCKFSFHGKLQVRVLYGSVRIYGYSLNSSRTSSPVAIYSPRAWSPVAIEAIDSEIPDRDVLDIWQTLKEQCNDRKLANRLQSDISSVEDGWAIITLKNFDNELTNFLIANCPFNLFPRIEDPSKHSWRDTRRAEIILQANLRFDNPGNQITIDSRGIDDVADAICYDWKTKENSRTIIGGGKGVGKSTTARYLVNKLLAKSESVVFLDLDPGQAEFTPAGCISLTVVDQPLLGPNFTHLKTPHYQLYVGGVDITRCLTHYVDGIKKLVDRLAEDTRLSQCPLIVNTMGFCKGIGWDVMSYVIKLVLPTDVVQILSRRSKNNFDDMLSRQVIDRQNLGWMTWTKDATIPSKPTKHRLHVIYSEAETGTGPAESWNLEAHQQRDLSMISYLSEIVKMNESASSKNRALSLSINAIPPYAIPFSAMSVSLAGAFVPQVLSVMNGNIVALCGVEPESAEESNHGGNISSYPRVLIRPPLSTCYGFGILRGVDMEKEQLFVNTPLSLDHMQHVNCLIGSTNVPQSLLQLNQEGAPYTGSEYDLPTSRGPRRGYFRTRCQVAT